MRTRRYYRRKRTTATRAIKKVAKNTKMIATIAKSTSPYTILNNAKSTPIYRTQRTLLGQTNVLAQTVSGTFSASSVPLFSQPPTGLNNNWGNMIIFQLNQVPNASDYTNLFQLYRIDKVEMSIRLVDDAGPDKPYPTLYATKLYQPSLVSGDLTIPNINQFQRVTRYQYSGIDRECKLVCKPYYLNVISGTTAGSNAPINVRKTGWIDTAYPNVNHYAMGFVLDNIAGADSGVISFEIDFTYHLSFMKNK